MTKFNLPEGAELPTSHQLNRATLLAIGVAGAILVTTVLPAEYGIDPTGIGGVLGLTPMGEMKSGAAPSAAPADAGSGDLTLDPEAPLVYSLQSGERSVSLAPGEGREIKAAMQAGGEFDYEWSTGGPPVHYELHGEPDGGKDGEYSSYSIGASAGEKGKFRAPFAGTQGWYWRNDGSKLVTVTIKAKGSWANFVVVPESN